MTLLIIGLDALDAKLIDHYELEQFDLGVSCELDTYAEMHPVPFTLEVWPTVATGLPPQEHGVTGAGTSQWDNLVVDFASNFTGQLTENMRSRLGDIAEQLTGAEWTFGVTERPTIFDGENRVVHNWPGVKNPEELQQIWGLMNAANDGEISREEFDREVLGIAAEQFGWAREMLKHDVDLAGVHVHTPDAFGHPYAWDEDRLCEKYERIAEFVTELRNALGEDDELLVLSDHGMQVNWFEEDENISKHSFRAYATTTLETVPESVYDVRDWVESNVVESDVARSEIEMPEETLRDLGYID